jgi:hypothetical protein
MRSRLGAALAAAVVLSLFTSTLLAAAPQRPAWARLGTTTVSDKVDRDTINVTARRGDFKALQIRVFERDVEFREVSIRFANGDLETVELRRVIQAGGHSRVVDIPGKDRVIRAIELVYDAQSLGGKNARVEVWGRH